MAPHELLEQRDFERLRDCLAIAARRLTKEQVHELADHLYCVLRRRRELASWDQARQGGTHGFI